MHRTAGHADRAAVGEVRRDVRDFLRPRVDRECIATVELLLSELMTNALIHTRHGTVVTATVDGRRIRVEVRDFAPEPPRVYVPNADDGTHGRGLVLVRGLADSWGVRTQPLGKVVWFELDGGKP
nr:ATP-binding protein [uncultured Streptomyces sp.]